MRIVSVSMCIVVGVRVGGHGCCECTLVSRRCVTLRTLYTINSNLYNMAYKVPPNEQ